MNRLISINAKANQIHVYNGDSLQNCKSLTLLTKATDYVCFNRKTSKQRLKSGEDDSIIPYTTCGIVHVEPISKFQEDRVKNSSPITIKFQIGKWIALCCHPLPDKFKIV